MKEYNIHVNPSAAGCHEVRNAHTEQSSQDKNYTPVRDVILNGDDKKIEETGERATVPTTLKSVK